jgi:hypothetical protein
MGWKTRTCGALPDLNNAETIHDFPSRCDEPDRAPFRDGKTYCLPVSQVQQQIGECLKFKDTGNRWKRT